VSRRRPRTSPDDLVRAATVRAKPDRPRDDPQRRWELTVDRVCEVLRREGLFERVVEVPAVGNAPTQLDAAKLIPRLTQDVLVHTWDLARAVGAHDRLDHAMVWNVSQPAAR
jgi:hypothetical protein